jgi:hypothetical protein
LDKVAARCGGSCCWKLIKSLSSFNKLKKGKKFVYPEYLKCVQFIKIRTGTEFLSRYNVHSPVTGLYHSVKSHLWVYLKHDLFLIKRFVSTEEFLLLNTWNLLKQILLIYDWLLTTINFFFKRKILKYEIRVIGKITFLVFYHS